MNGHSTKFLHYLSDDKMYDFYFTYAVRLDTLYL